MLGRRAMEDRMAVFPGRWDLSPDGAEEVARGDIEGRQVDCVGVAEIAEGIEGARLKEEMAHGAMEGRVGEAEAIV